MAPCCCAPAPPALVVGLPGSGGVAATASFQKPAPRRELRWCYTDLLLCSSCWGWARHQNLGAAKYGRLERYGGGQRALSALVSDLQDFCSSLDLCKISARGCGKRRPVTTRGVTPPNPGSLDPSHLELLKCWSWRSPCAWQASCAPQRWQASSPGGPLVSPCLPRGGPCLPACSGGEHVQGNSHINR